MITTSIQDATSPHAEAILATASGLDIAYYRGEYFRYDYVGDLWRQIQELKPRVAGLAALNEKDPDIRRVPHPLWRRQHRRQHLGSARWIDAAHVVARPIRALAIEDIVWCKGPDGRWRIDYCPLGEGMIDVDRLLSLLAASISTVSSTFLRTQQPARHESRHLDAADQPRAIRDRRAEGSAVSQGAARRSGQGVSGRAARRRPSPKPMSRFAACSSVQDRG